MSGLDAVQQKLPLKTPNVPGLPNGIGRHTSGLGENIPMSTANLGDGFVALKDDKMITIRIPYPLSFYAKGFDGRIDDMRA